MPRRWRVDRDELPIKRDEDEELLDTREQEELVRSFEVNAKFQSMIWRGIFASFALAFGGFFMYSAYLQSTSPWGSRYQADLINALESRHVVFADTLEACTCLAIAFGLLSQSKWHRRVLWASIMFSVALSLFLLRGLLSLPQFRWRILWLPLGTPSLAALCLYVDSMLLETAKDIQRLRAFMYHYKKS